MSIFKRNRIVYYLSSLFHSLIFTIPVWVVYYQGRISTAQISFLVTIQYVIQMICELPSGALADLIGRRWTILSGFVLRAISFLLFPFCYSFWHFIVLSVFLGVADSLRSGSEEAIIYDTLKQEGRDDEIRTVYTSGSNIYQVGLIIATALGGVIYRINPDMPFTLYGIALVFGSIVTFFYIEPSLDSEKFTLKNYLLQMVNGAKEAFKTDYTKTLSLFYIFVAGIGWSSTLYFNGYMMVDLVFDDDIRGVLTAVMRLINVVVISKVLINKKLFNWKRAVLFFPAIMLFGYLPGIWLDGYAGLPFVQAAMIATTARWVVLSPMTNNVFSSKYRATAISLLSLLIGFVYIALTSVSALVIPTYGIKMMYTLLGVITLFTVVPIGVRLLKVKKLGEC